MRVLVTENERVRKDKRSAMLKQDDAFSFAGNGSVAYTSRNWRVYLSDTRNGRVYHVNSQRSSQTILTTLDDHFKSPFICNCGLGLFGPYGHGDNKSCCANRDHCLGGWIIKTSRLSFRFSHQLNAHTHTHTHWLRAAAWQISKRVSAAYTVY